MRFPQMNKQALRGIRVPEVSGGINLRDSSTLINDNQLTECMNMWYSEGTLKTRPGWTYIGKNDIESGVYTSQSSRSFDVFCTGEVGPMRLCSYCQINANTNTTVIYFFWSDGVIFKKHTKIELDTVVSNYFVTQNRDKVYLFAANEIYDISDVDGNKRLSSEEKYIPIVMTHGLSDISHNVSGTLFEGYNLINNRCKYILSSFNKNILKDDDITHAMSYGMLYPKNTDLSQFEGQTVEVEYTFPSGEQVKYTAVLDAYGKGSSETINNMQLQVHGLYFEFVKAPENSGAYTTGEISAAEYVEDNMIITQPCTVSQGSLDKVFGMKECEWFGGAASGISGGTRLFLCGNAKEPNLLVWSGLNDPTYFPEHCNAYVGSSNSSITAFGKQSNFLAIFKEYETYYTYYADNTNISSDSLINYSVVDYTANRVYFPIILLNSSVGCDCPNTVQLCRNRLVWTNSDGSVYTLVSNNQYNERSIFLVSDMVKSALKKERNIKNGTACDWNGMYVLQCDNKIYLMDYNSYGFQYVTSYSKQEDANRQIPWYIWESPLNTSAIIFTIANQLLYFAVVSEEGNMYTTAFKLDTMEKRDSFPKHYTSDEEIIILRKEILCSCTTKFFDFNIPNSRKRVESVGLSLGNDCNLRVVFLTDSGNEEIFVSINSKYTEVKAPDYINSIILNPSIRSVIRFGIRFESEGFLDINGITLNYRMLGGAR